MTYHPRCWHCTHPKLYWCAWAVAVMCMALAVAPFYTLLALWALMALPVALANFAPRLWAVIR